MPDAIRGWPAMKTATAKPGRAPTTTNAERKDLNPNIHPGVLRRAAAMAALILLGACAGLQTARIELPVPLAQAVPLTMEGPIGAAQGTFALGATRGRFERQASRIELFNRLAQDRAALSYTLEPEGVRADCKLIGNTATLGVLQLPLKRAAYACSFSRDGQPLPQQLELQAVDAAAGTREERRGRFVAGSVTLEVQSLHRVQGSPLPLSAPVGYVLRHQGEPVAALDLNDLRPRLWLRAPSEAVATAVMQAVPALALLWDPAAR